MQRERIVTDLTLYFAPDSCARVPLIALEEIGHPYKLEIVAFMKGQHRSPEYLALNPRGKVPTLVVDGVALSENVAILTWLSEAFPHANLLPASEDSFARAGRLSDLAYCASGLHPIVTRLRVPQYFCDTPEGVKRVVEMAAIAMRPNFALIDKRLGDNRWWFGEHWSIVDAYINWVWFRVTSTGFDTSDYTNFARHNGEIGRRPAVERALQISRDVAERLAAQGLAVKFSGAGAVTAPAG